MDVPRNGEGLARKQLLFAIAALGVGGLGFAFDRDSRWELLHLIPLSGTTLFGAMIVLGVVLLGVRSSITLRDDGDRLRVNDRGLLLPRKGGLVPWARIRGFRLRNNFGSIALDVFVDDGDRRVGELHLGPDPAGLADYLERVRVAPDPGAALRSPPSFLRG